MSTWKSVLLAGAMTIAPLHAAAQEAPPAEAVAYDVAEDADEGMTADDVAQAKAKMQKEMDQALALIEKLFDTSDLPPIEPARLTLAQTTTAALIPSGSLEKMIDRMYGRFIKMFLEEMSGKSDLMLSIKTGIESDKIAALDDATKEKVADMFDPHRKEREGQIMNVVKPLVSEVLADMEAPMRQGLARAYARQFTVAQLGEINSFFATPTGAAFAGESMVLQADPEVMLALVKAIPPMVNKFIDRAPQLEKQFKDLPKERSLADLSDSEISKLAKLMKVDVKELKQHRDSWMDAEEAAVDAAADGADEDLASYDRATWSEVDRERVEKLEEAADAASTAAFEAEQQAIANARKSMGADPTTE